MVVNGRVDRENWIRVAVSTGAFDEEMAGLNFDAFDVDGNGYVMQLSTCGYILAEHG